MEKKEQGACLDVVRSFPGSSTLRKAPSLNFRVLSENSKCLFVLDLVTLPVYMAQSLWCEFRTLEAKEPSD